MLLNRIHLLLTLCNVFVAMPSMAQSLTVPATEPLQVQLVKAAPLKQGQSLHVQLLYPVYVENQLALPAGSMLDGKVVRLVADKHRRVAGRLEGDFTPFIRPVVAFHAIRLPDGKRYPVSTDVAAEGAPTLHLAAAAPHPDRGWVRAQIELAKQTAKDQIAVFTAPDKKDRLLQFVYGQLPYHPQRIEKGTAWTTHLAAPVEVPAASTVDRVGTPSNFSATAKASDAPKGERTANTAEHTGSELLHASLTAPISSATAKVSDTFEARIEEPLYGPDHQLKVPEGAVLVGTVTQAKRAKSFARRGNLRFTFRELRVPNAKQQDVNGMLAGADADTGSGLQIDSEGGVRPKQKNRVVVPLVLTMLASRALDNDGSQAANGAVASNGFGLVGRIAGIVSAPRAVAASIGFYGAGLAFFNRWIAHGKDVTFVKDTRIDVLMSPARSRLRTTE